MRKKLIEVALPLEAINAASAREKSIRHGHPSTLHLWWARRPLAACRAVLFAQLVDDPSSHPDKFPTEESQEAERERLFEIIRNLVKWENSNNEHVLSAARAEILKSTEGNPPPVLDPFCGGGSIPLEGQRLGLKAHASDLNPVAVLITKALIEIPPKFAGLPPVHPLKDHKLFSHEWHGTEGLVEDIRYYGRWIRDEAEKRIGHLYPKVKLPKKHGGGEAIVIAWLWTRTVKCPNPACGAMMPLMRSFALSTKPGKEVWIKPIIDRTERTVSFEVMTGVGAPLDPPKIGRGAKFRCLFCSEVASEEDIRAEFQAKRNSEQLIAIVAEGEKGRVYLPPKEEHIVIAKSSLPKWKPEEEMNQNTSNLVSGRGYGITRWHELFTSRQLIALTTLSELISEVRKRVQIDALNMGMADGSNGINGGGTGATAYADTVATYLAFCLDKNTLTNCTQATWQTKPDRLTQAFARQALPMTWDYAEANPLSDAGGGYSLTLDSLAEVLANLPQVNIYGNSTQSAATAINGQHHLLISTDPPYYDAIGYADLSDFFYIWLRRTLGAIYPDMFSTVLTPKSQELVATPHRFDGDKQKAKQFFEEGLRDVFVHLREAQNRDYPLTVYYAFKQSETNGSEEEEQDNGLSLTASTGWETMLEGLIQAGLSVTGTWPVRTELIGNLKKNVSALASSIVLVCRPRPESSSPVTRREFVTALKREVPDALRKLQHGNIAPVDLAQASIGPGMAIFSRYAKVLEANGQPMSVRTALQIINQELDAYLATQEGELDRDTRFCLAWFEQYGMNEGPFGEADVLARAKNTAVKGMEDAGVIYSKGSKVRLLKRSEYPEQWNPNLDHRLTVWECTQHLIRQLDIGGEDAAARLVNQLGGRSEDARALAYRLYSICERKKWADEALAYNTLVVEWPAIQDKAAQFRVMPTEQANLFG